MIAFLMAALFAVPGMARAGDAAPAPQGPLSLEECVSMALGGHPKIKAARQDLSAGQWNTMLAASGFWPSLSFDINRNFQHSERPVRIGGNAVSTKASFISNNFIYNTNWTIFDFGRTYYAVKTLAEIENSITQNLGGAEQTVAYDVMDAYFGVLKAQSLVKVAGETLDNAKVHLKYAQGFFDAGVKPRFDVTTAEVAVNDADLTVLQAKDAVRSARVTLNLKVGLPPQADTQVEERPAPEGLSKPIEAYQDMAVKNRPEIQSLSARLKSDEMNVRAQLSDYLPEITAQASQTWYKEDHTDMTSSQAVQVALHMPIFDGFRTTAAVGQARANMIGDRYRLDDLKLTVMNDVSVNYIQVEDAKARADELESSVKKAKENLEIANGRYEAGVGAYLEVTDAQVALTKAETDRITAIYDYHLAYSRLLRSIGADVKPGGEWKSAKK